MEPYPIRYEFRFADGRRVDFNLQLDPETLQLQGPLPQSPPEWTRLEYQRCPNCTLDPATTSHCPTALRLVEVVSAFAQTCSFEEVELRVTTPERTMLKDGTAQIGVSALFGIYMSASGCPMLAWLRPLVRFHLPFATELETLFRAVSMYLIAQLLRSDSGETPDWTLDGLTERYIQTGEVNRAFARRLRDAAPQDASINGLVLLDLFAKIAPSRIEDKLASLRQLYASWGLKSG